MCAEAMEMVPILQIICNALSKYMRAERERERSATKTIRHIHISLHSQEISKTRNTHTHTHTCFCYDSFCLLCLNIPSNRIFECCWIHGDFFCVLLYLVLQNKKIRELKRKARIIHTYTYTYWYHQYTNGKRRNHRRKHKKGKWA